MLGTRAASAHRQRLLNGKVLVTGGYGQGNGVLANAEVYDPVTGLGPHGNMRVRRAFHTATLLPTASSWSLAARTAPVRNVRPGNWNMGEAGALTGAHSRHTATMLPGGKVLVVGGIGAVSVVAELFDPATRTWTLTGNLNVGRHFHTATLLPDGKVLAAGRVRHYRREQQCRGLRPSFGTWISVANLATNRTGHSASLLGNGKVLVAGGGNNSNPVLATAELFDPTTNTWTSGASLTTARVSHTATILPSGQGPGGRRRRRDGCLTGQLGALRIRRPISGVRRQVSSPAEPSIPRHCWRTAGFSRQAEAAR